MPAWRWRNVPLPEAHLVGLGAGLVIDLLFPWGLLSAAWLGLAGWLLVIGGAALAASAVAVAAEVDLERPDRLVVTGPYRFSRNPMYVAWSAIYVGLSFVFDTAWPVVLLPPVLVVMHYVGVLREERHLEGRFGDEFRSYRARVRRYL